MIGFPSSPTEFVLVKFHVRADKREVSAGEANIYGGELGVSGKYVVDFNYESLENGVFRVTPAKLLENDKYGFYLLDTRIGVQARFFDFSIQVTL